AAAHTTAVVVQVVVHDVGVIRIDAWILLVLIFRAVALVILVKHVVVVYQRVRRAGEKVQKELFDLRIVYALDLGRVVEVLALGFAVRERDAELVHALGAVWRKTGVVLLHASRVAQHLRKIKASPPDVMLFLAQRFCVRFASGIPPKPVGRNDRVGRLLV